MSFPHRRRDTRLYDLYFFFFKCQFDRKQGVGRLQFLSVDGNNISAIAESAFQGLGQLAHLVLR